MDQEKRTFQLRINRLIPVVCLYAIAAIAALIGLLDFSLTAYRNMLLQMEIWDPSVVLGANIGFSLLGAMSVLFPGALAICMFLGLCKRPGFSVLSDIADISGKIVRILRYVLIVIFVYRSVTYILQCLREDMVVYLIMAMLMFEGLFGVAFYFCLQLLMKFFASAADVLASVQYMHASGTVEYCDTHVTVCRVLTLLGLFGIGLAVYLILFPFTGILCAVGLILAAIANFWVSILLKTNQTRISHIIYQQEKARKAQLHSER